MDFAVTVNHRVKEKETEKIKKGINFARELKKLYNMKVTITPILLDVPGTVPEVFVKRLEESCVYRKKKYPYEKKKPGNLLKAPRISTLYEWAWLGIELPTVVDMQKKSNQTKQNFIIVILTFFLIN